VRRRGDRDVRRQISALDVEGTRGIEELMFGLKEHYTILVVTHNMANPLRKTWEATPGPKVVIAIGDCAIDCGVFADGYGVAGSVGDVLPVDVEVPGCPPDPRAILAALRGLSG